MRYRANLIAAMVGGILAVAEKNNPQKCFACDRPLGCEPHRVDTRDGQTVFVGMECYGLVLDAGNAGYQPPKGGPRLYPMP